MEDNAFYKPECKLIGEDGNVFFIISRVCRTLRKFGYPDKAEEFQKKATTECGSYYEVLQLVDEYVIIT